MLSDSLTSQGGDETSFARRIRLYQQLQQKEEAKEAAKPEHKKNKLSGLRIYVEDDPSSL